MTPSELELDVLAHRYLYYVLAQPALTDYDYDRLESKAKRTLPDDSPVHSVGSDLPGDYDTAVVARAMVLLRGESA